MRATRILKAVFWGSFEGSIRNGKSSKQKEKKKREREREIKAIELSVSFGFFFVCFEELGVLIAFKKPLSRVSNKRIRF